MKMIIKKSLLIFSLLFLYNCGFKVVDNSNTNDFKIKEIKVIGDKRINYKIKNYLLLNTAKENKKVLLINLNTKKNKNIKEKNIKNQVTKYEMSINTSIKLHLLDSGKKASINLSVTGEYSVASNYSSTRNNEKKLVDSLTGELSKNILNEINLKINDF
jgi:outer membrane lipopolysaccharide assembly protein LptE/RlpB